MLTAAALGSGSNRKHHVLGHVAHHVAIPLLKVELHSTAAADALLSGEQPYSRIGAMEIFQGVVSEQLRPAIRAAVPAVLADVVRKCWAHDPADRPNMPAVLEMLDKATQQPSESDKPGVFSLAAGFSRNRALSQSRAGRHSSLTFERESIQL